MAMSLVWAQGALAADVTVAGNLTDDMRERLLAASLVAEQVAKPDATVSDIVSSAQADYSRLVAVLYDAGFFAPVVRIQVDGREAADIAPVAPPARVGTVRILVETGKKFRFGRVRIAPLAPGTALPEAVQPGQTAGVTPLRDAVGTAISDWRALGHAKAKPTGQSITANHPAGTLSADLSVEPGPVLRFGKLNVAGNTTVKTRRVIKMAGLPAGQRFDPEELELAATRLRRARVFKSVALAEDDAIGPGQTLDITATLVEQAPRRFGFGGELSSLEGLTLSTFWLHRNLWGGAERLRLDAKVKGIGGDSGGTDYRLAARFDRPATFNADTDFYALAEIEQLDEVSFFSRRASAELGIRRIASQKREYTFGFGVHRALTEDAFGDRDYTLFTVPMGLTFEYRDAPLNATKGYYLKAGVTPFLAISGSDNGVRSTLDWRVYRSFGDVRPVTLAFRAQLGSVAGPSLSQSPADFLFYSGGGGTVRGQPYQSLAVDLGGGKVVGGRSFVGLSAEARFKATDTIGLVGFVDAGYIGTEAFPDGSSGSWHSGAGIGLRYDTGIGPIRLDLAVPTSGPDAGSKLQVYIGIGQSF